MDVSRAILSAVLVACACPALAADTGPLAADVESRLAGDVRYLASEELEGRGLGSRGNDLAAQYIAGRFQQLGLRTDVCRGGPYQWFEATTEVLAGPDNRLTLVGPTSAESRAGLRVHAEFVPLAAGDSVPFDLPLVLVGYGITAGAAGYDDYAGVDVRGKAVVVLRHQPRRLATSGVPISGEAINSRHALLRRKVANAYEHGAAAVVFCADHTSLHAGREELLLKVSAAGLRAAHPGLPVLCCRRSLLEPAIRAAFGKSLSEIELEVDGGQPRSRELTGWRLTGRTDIRRTMTSARNVVAVLPGNGSTGETIVVGAHYDHFGVQETLVQGKKQKAIYFGADDNASGVAVLLELARQFSMRRAPLPRQLVFVAFSGEELGLLGSSYYVAHPVAPLDTTVAMINFDMVGRLKDNKLFVRGSFTARDWEQQLLELNARHGLALDLRQGRYGSSDQLCFYARSVPILHFFTGRHEDYHEPSDTYDKVNVPGMRRVADLAGEMLERMVEAPARPSYVAAVLPEEKELYFGAFGDFTSSDTGFALGPVAKGGPAEEAGLASGDVIVQMGEHRIAGPDDFEEALSHFNQDERVRVVARRGSVSRSVHVRLRGPSNSPSAAVAVSAGREPKPTTVGARALGAATQPVRAIGSKAKPAGAVQPVSRTK